MQTELSKHVEENHSNLSNKSFIIHPRLAWMLYYQEVHMVKKVCERFGISRKTFYKWWNRYDNSGKDTKSLFDISKKPHHSPLATPQHIIQVIIKAKLETGYGQRKLKKYIKNKYDISLSEHTIWKITKQYSNDNGVLLDPNVILDSDCEAGNIIQMSVKKIHAYAKPQPYVMYTAIDQATHLRISKIYEEPLLENTIDFIKFIKDKFPFLIKMLYTPMEQIFEINTSQLCPTSSLNINQIEQRYFTNHQLETSLVASVHAQDDQHFFKESVFTSIDDANRKLKRYLNNLNNHRQMSTLNGLTPLQKLRMIEEYRKILYFDLIESD
jgi:transposase